MQLVPTSRPCPWITDTPTIMTTTRCDGNKSERLGALLVSQAHNHGFTNATAIVRVALSCDPAGITCLREQVCRAWVAKVSCVQSVTKFYVNVP